MSEQSAIGWTDHTFNPWWGCVKVSPGCKNCYAETLSSRWKHDVWGTSPRRTFGEKHWKAPLKWAPGRVFCGSMCDVLEDAPGLAEQRTRLWDLIATTPHLTWMLLTKRPENAKMIPPVGARSVLGGRRAVLLQTEPRTAAGNGRRARRAHLEADPRMTGLVFKRTGKDRRL